MARYLAIGEGASVERADRDGWIAYRVRAASPDSLRTADGLRTVEAIGDTFGFVHQLEARFPVSDRYPTPPGGTVHYAVTYSAVGETTVEPPPWLAEARRVTRNQTYVGQG